MNRLGCAPDFAADFSCTKGWQELLPSPTEPSSPHLGRSGYSVERRDLPGVGYLGLSAPRQDVDDSSRVLDDISISHSSPDSALISVDPWNNNTQHQLPTETARVAATDYSRSDPFLPLAPEQVCLSPASKVSDKDALSDQDEANQGKIPLRSLASARGKKARAERATNSALRNKQRDGKSASDRARERRYIYSRSDRGKRVRIKYARSEKGRLTRAKSQAKYRATLRGKLSRFVVNAKYSAYRSAKKKGLSEEDARQQSELVAREKKIQYLLNMSCTSWNVEDSVETETRKPEQSVRAVGSGPWKVDVK